MAHYAVIGSKMFKYLFVYFLNAPNAYGQLNFLSDPVLESLF